MGGQDIEMGSDVFVERRRNAPWHMDKKVPIGLILVVCVQTITLIVWAAKLDSKVEDHERRIVMGETFDHEYARANADTGQRMARMEEKMSAQTQMLERIEILVRDHMNRGERR